MSATQTSTRPLRIVLIGLPGSGKSAVARAVAQRLGWTAVDCDDLIVERERRNIPDIFASQGEPRFRELERETIERIAAMDFVAVGTGGGSVLSAANRRRLWSGGFVVALTGQPSTLLARVAAMDGGASSRPLLSGPSPEDRLRELTAERASLYGLADWTVQTDGLAPDEIAGQIVDAYRQFGARLLNRAGRMTPHAIEDGPADADPDLAATVRTPAGEYGIAVGWGNLHSLGSRLRRLGIAGRVHVITDDHVGALYADAVLSSLAEADYEVGVCQIRPGEDHKTLSAAESTIDWLVSRRAERREAIVALGGGVVTDLAGFVAATFLRGVPLVHVPTSLLGAVDAAIGGKVAVDHRLGKNLIGAFYQPRLVLIDAAALRTLPPRELASGWAEVIKHGLITDERLVSYLEQNAAAVCSLQPEALLPVLRRSAQIKAAVVSADERESGLRSTLNYGHTMGHALEAAEGYQGPLHGEAVAVGMAGAGEIGRRLRLLSDEELQRQNRLIAAYGLPLQWPGADTEAILAATALDKKTTAATIRWVLLNGIGKTVGRSDVPAEMVREVVRRLVAAPKRGARLESREL